MEIRDQREGKAVLNFRVPSVKERRTHRHRKYALQTEAEKVTSSQEVNISQNTRACFLLHGDFKSVFHLCDALVRSSRVSSLVSSLVILMLRLFVCSSVGPSLLLCLPFLRLFTLFCHVFVLLFLVMNARVEVPISRAQGSGRQEKENAWLSLIVTKPLSVTQP